MASQLGSGLDGRSARRVRNRERVVDALLDAIEAGEPSPTIRELAERSGVSERSVFRYFGDMEEVLSEAADRAMRRYEQYAVIPDIGEGDLDHRIGALIESRIRLWVKSGPVAAAARRRSLRSPALQVGFDLARRWSREQLREHFAPELARLAEGDVELVLSLLEVTTAFESFRLHVEEGIDADELRRRWRYAIVALLEGSPVASARN